MEELKKELAEYIAILETSLACTNYAEDKLKYQKHLAESALMFTAIEKYKSLKKLKELVSLERHSYGWDYLNGVQGSSAELAFDHFAKLVETL
jgi:hypothetical protein